MTAPAHVAPARVAGHRLRLAAALALSLAVLALLDARVGAPVRAQADAREGPARGGDPGAGGAEEVGEIEEVEEIGEIETVDDLVVEPGAAQKELTIIEAAGRMHPALVHLPIAWLTLLLLVDLVGLGLRREPFRVVGIWLAGLTVLSFIPAAVTGLIRYGYPPYEGVTEGMVFVHRNLMFATAGVTTLAFVLRLARRNQLSGALRFVYLGLLFAAVTLVTIAGHIGAELVLGEDYLPF